MLLPTSVYQPLKVFLANRPAEEQQITLTFAEVEAILGRPLPASAYVARSWWANRTNPAERTTQARAWHEAGWHASRADRIRHVVTFTRVQP